MNLNFIDFQIFPVADEKTVLQRAVGRNQKHILVVYREEDGQNVLKQLLEKILSAAKFKVEDDVLLLNLNSKKNFSFTQLQKTITLKELLLFGIEPDRLGLQFDYQKYQIIKHLDCRYLFADDLADIKDNQQLKGALWSCLKEMYLEKEN